MVKIPKLPVGLTSLIVAVCIFHFCTETYLLLFLYADVHDLQSSANLSVCLYCVQWTFAWELPVTL